MFCGQLAIDCTPEVPAGNVGIGARGKGRRVVDRVDRDVDGRGITRAIGVADFVDERIGAEEIGGRGVIKRAVAVVGQQPIRWQAAGAAGRIGGCRIEVVVGIGVVDRDAMATNESSSTLALSSAAVGGWLVTSTASFSNAPMSQVAVESPSPSAGRENPRWSVAGQFGSSPLSMAGLPAINAWVRVGPPFSASGPSIGSAPVMIVLDWPFTWVQLPASMRLKLPLKSPSQSAGRRVGEDAVVEEDLVTAFIR